MSCEIPNKISIETQAHDVLPESVVAAFDDIVIRNGHRVAIIFQDQSITFLELAARVQALASNMQKNGVVAGSVVALCMDKSPDIVAGMLAVLKCGCTYLPIDPASPPSRLAYILNDCAPSMVLCADSYGALFAEYQLNVLTLVDLDNACTDFSVPLESAESAYLLYTSGSTGNPKGVLVPDRGILRLVKYPQWISLSNNERILFHSPYTFDASTFEIWAAILNGLTLVIYPKKIINILSIERFISEHSITTLWLTAALFHVVSNHNPEFAKGLKNLVVGGDTLQQKAIERVLIACPQLTVINGYGPTENTVFTTCYPMRLGDDIPACVPVGRPIADTRLYILNEEKSSVPLGELGELYVAGGGVATGYLNRPELNAKCFVKIPGIENNSTLYKTGDLVRLGVDGLLHFVGRVDDQVKVSGYRIELKEIESVLLQHSGVIECAVIAPRDDDGNRVIGAYMKIEGPEIIEEIKVTLKQILPDYMVPSRFFPVDDFPLNVNGKIDRKKLESQFLQNIL